jgi:tRNA pseudouridine38-40 synthase
VAHVDLDDGTKRASRGALSGYDLAKAVNAHLRPLPVCVVCAEKTGDDFHARFSARNKLYCYRIVNRPAPLTLDVLTATHIRRPLDVKAMGDAAALLLGHHDFTTFRDSACQAKTPFRTLDRLDVVACPYDAQGGVSITIEAEARSFLHHQVRNMAGSLILVGEGKWAKDDMRAALDAKDRTKGGPTAPPEGLCLMRIDYDAPLK